MKNWQEVYECFVGQIEHEQSGDYSDDSDLFEAFCHGHINQSDNFSKFMELNSEDLYQFWWKEESNSCDPMNWHEFACVSFMEALEQFELTEFIN